MIAIGCDHIGFLLKKSIIDYLEKQGFEYKDFGTDSDKSCDYPIYAKRVAEAVVSGECDRGILLCGTGLGVSITANKYKGIRAAVCHDVFSAEATRLHNDANILAMGSRVIGPGLAVMIADKFLHTGFSGEERHVRRISMIEDNRED